MPRNRNQFNPDPEGEAFSFETRDERYRRIMAQQRQRLSERTIELSANWKFGDIEINEQED